MEAEGGADQAPAVDEIPAVGATGRTAPRAVAERGPCAHEVVAVTPAALAELDPEVHGALHARRSPPADAPRVDDSPAPGGPGHDGGTAAPRRWSRSLRRGTEPSPGVGLGDGGCRSRLTAAASRATPPRRLVPASASRATPSAPARPRVGFACHAIRAGSSPRRLRVPRHPFCVAAARRGPSSTGFASHATIVPEEGGPGPAARREAERIASDAMCPPMGAPMGPDAPRSAPGLAPRWAPRRTRCAPRLAPRWAPRSAPRSAPDRQPRQRGRRVTPVSRRPRSWLDPGSRLRG